MGKSYGTVAKLNVLEQNFNLGCRVGNQEDLNCIMLRVGFHGYLNNTMQKVGFRGKGQCADISTHFLYVNLSVIKGFAIRGFNVVAIGFCHLYIKKFVHHGFLLHYSISSYSPLLSDDWGGFHAEERHAKHSNQYAFFSVGVSP